MTIMKRSLQFLLLTLMGCEDSESHLIIGLSTRMEDICGSGDKTYFLDPTNSSTCCKEVVHAISE